MTDFTSVLPFIRIHAAAEAPRESCGIVIADPDGKPVYIACKNLAKETEHFVLDSADFARAEDTGEIIAIAHSHVFESPAPSSADLTGIERTRVPWLIVNHPLGTFTITKPSGYVAPLVGRAFVHGSHDCYGLIRDAFRERGVELPEFDRVYGWWDEPNGPELYGEENITSAGFAIIHRGSVDSNSLKSLHPYDVLIIQVAAKHPNHGAVYIGNGMILHHLIGQLSRREFFGEHWQKRTVLVLRHKSMMKESD